MAFIIGCPPCTACCAAVARKVGASSLVFCDASIGQFRTLLRSSSGAKSRRVMAPPASRPVTSMPACARGSAATPPAAPSPMITTSVSFSLVAMRQILVRVRVALRRRLVERLVVVSRFVIRRQLMRFERLLVGWRHHRADAGVAEQIPADEVRVASVVRVAEHALSRVIEDQREELRGAA